MKLGTKLLRGALCFFLVFAGSCRSEPLDDTCSESGVVRQPLDSKCQTKQLSPVTDPSSPDYGRVPCQMLTAWPQGSADCACDAPGFAPVTAAQAAFASVHFSACSGPCCDNLCFCELLQQQGDALAACQSRLTTAPPDDAANGWCYLDPALGFGTVDQVGECPAGVERRLWFYPQGPRYSVDAVLECVGDL